jgi:hypothetical protein
MGPPRWPDGGHAPDPLRPQKYQLAGCEKHQALILALGRHEPVPP